MRLITEDGEQLGVKSVDEGLKRAREEGLDLVEIAPQANPPVCKIMDYKKYRYEQEKKMKEARKHQKVFQQKEIRLRPKIGIHDLEIKIRHAQELLQDGHRIKFTMFFRGRERAHVELGREIINMVKQKLTDDAIIERDMKMEGSRMIIIMAPKKH